MPRLPALSGSPGPLRRLASLLQSPGAAPTIQLTIQVSATRLVQWLDLLTRVSGVGVTPMHAVARATALALDREPWSQAVTVRGRPQALPGIDLCLQVPGPDPADDQKRLFYRWFRPRAASASVPAMSREMQLGLAPVPPGTPLPPCAALLTGQEASGVSLTHAPLPGGMACPLHLTLNPIEQTPLAIHGAVVTRRMLIMGAAFDARSFEVHEATAVARQIKLILEDPRRLETVDQFTGNLTATDTSTELELPDPTESGLEQLVAAPQTPHGDDDASGEPEPSGVIPLDAIGARDPWA
jgi:hypothetical protein